MILFVRAHEAAGDVHRNPAVLAPVRDDPSERPRGVRLMRARPEIDSNAHAAARSPYDACDRFVFGERGQCLEVRASLRAASRRIKPPRKFPRG
jgi:hypothetical protein